MKPLSFGETPNCAGAGAVDTMNISLLERKVLGVAARSLHGGQNMATREVLIRKGFKYIYVSAFRVRALRGGSTFLGSKLGPLISEAPVSPTAGNLK